MTTHNTRQVILATVIPSVIVLAAAAAQISVFGDLPDPVATHFGTSGANGFGPAWTYPAMTIGIGALMIGIAAIAKVQAGAATRFISALMPGIVIALTTAFTWTVFTQRGLADAATAPDPLPGMLIGGVIGLAYGALVYAVLPAYIPTDHEEEQPEPRHITKTQRVAWMQTVKLGPGILTLLIASTALVIGVAILVTIQEPAASVFTWIMAALVTLLFLMMCAFRVRIDDSGLQVRSIVGIPRWHIPLDQIAEVRTLQVDPMGDFGGWGLRWHPTNGTGLVVRRGEGIFIKRTNGKRLTISVDDAERAAEILLGLKERASS